MMELYLMRHGIAEETAVGGRDAERALTAEGRKRLKEVLRTAAKAGVAPGLILTSPYRRARETAEMAASELGYKGEIVETGALVPYAHVQEMWEEVRVHKGESSLLVASHEPLMGQAAGFIVNSPGLRIDVKKGSMLRIDVEGFGSQPVGVLKWYLTPRLAS
ncbi:MAG: phosphohistidine phosphatase SixA [Acidobacteriota bacterium]|jgi:phosphohistidine phosphatase